MVEQLRPACTRTRTFCWLAITLAALSVRSDLQGGVSSCVRALGLQARTYLRRQPQLWQLSLESAGFPR